MSRFSLTKAIEFLWKMISIALMVLIVAGLFYYFFNNSELGGRIKNYIPVALNENEKRSERDD